MPMRADEVKAAQIALLPEDGAKVDYSVFRTQCITMLDPESGEPVGAAKDVLASYMYDAGTVSMSFRPGDVAGKPVLQIARKV